MMWELLLPGSSIRLFLVWVLVVEKDSDVAMGGCGRRAWYVLHSSSSPVLYRASLGTCVYVTHDILLCSIVVVLTGCRAQR